MNACPCSSNSTQSILKFAKRCLFYVTEYMYCQNMAFIVCLTLHFEKGNGIIYEHEKDIKGLSNESVWKLPKNIENMALLCRKKIERRNIYNYIFDIELVTFACPFLDCILPCFGVGTEKYFINWKLLGET